MAYRRDRVVVLKKEAIRDYDRRYTLYGQSHGLCVVFSRSSSKLHSRQAGHLEPFSDAEVMVANGRFYDHLAVARQAGVESRKSKVESQGLEGYVLMGRFVDLVVKLLRPGVTDARIFDLLLDIRELSCTLPKGTTTQRMRFLLASGTLKLLELLGFALPFDDIDEQKLWKLSDSHIAILRLLRHAPVRDALRLTAPVQIIDEVSDYVEHGLYTTPLVEEFKGAEIMTEILN